MILGNVLKVDLFHIKQQDRNFSKTDKNKILISHKRFEGSIITASSINRGCSFFFAIKLDTLMQIFFSLSNIYSFVEKELNVRSCRKRLQTHNVLKCNYPQKSAVAAAAPPYS